MKMYGSNDNDTLIGTKKLDTIYALNGNDLIGTNGGADIIKGGSGNDLITGFSFDLNNVFRSAYRNSDVDGGAGDFDIMIVELKAARRVSHVDSFLDAMKAKGIEEFIYNFTSVSAKQQIFGTKNSETIVIGGGDANVDMGNGNDYVFTAGGEDIVKGGSGNDFIHAGEGHNTVFGGAGTDSFHFRLTDVYQYTKIEDFKANEDKILISIDMEQVNRLFEPDFGYVMPKRFYGDGHYGVGPDLNEYVSYNHGRFIDASDFKSGEVELMFDDWAIYEQETGSIFIKHYEDEPWGQTIEERVLVAHVEAGTVIGESDFRFKMI